jgi:hypothetical protein
MEDDLGELQIKKTRQNNRLLKHGELRVDTSQKTSNKNSDLSEDEQFYETTDGITGLTCNM